MIKKIKEIKKSTIILIAIIVIYTIISFVNLGDTKALQTLKVFEKDEVTYLYLPKKPQVGKVKVYVGNNISNIELYLVDSSKKDEKYELEPNLQYDSVFKWIEFDVRSEEHFSSLVFRSKGENNVIGEVAVYDKEGQKIELQTIMQKDEILIDEQDLVPETSTFMNSTYFDEIYHARTAYEQLHDIEPYECVHPPLGKILISIPIHLFGMTPFNYRIMGNIAGILMIFVMYLIGKELFKKERYGLIAAAIIALDGMHFVQTRIATVDSFLVLFCLLAFLFMIKYIHLDRKEPDKIKLKNLCFSGIFIGMAIATKWTAFFVAMGLAIIFFTHFIYNIVKYKFSKKDIKVILYCILFFVIIPMAIYMISYIPLFLNEGCRIKDFESFIKYQLNIYNYHSKLQAEHPFTSSWYTWPILYKPMWYYIKYYPNDIVSTISCMGNPFIWWVSIASTIFALINSIVKKSKEALPILVLIVTTWLTYIFIGRIMFIYHYFITLPFAMLTIVFALKKIEEKWNKKIITVLTLIVFLVGFVYFYPVYSGKKVSKEYIEQTKWFETWIY